MLGFVKSLSRVTPPTLPPVLQATIRRAVAITQNQWYDLWTGLACAAGAGSSKKNVRVYHLGFGQATAGETIEVRIIADNIDETIAQAVAAGAYYTIFKECAPTNALFFLWDLVANDLAKYQAFNFEARNLQIMYRKTTAAGANVTSVKITYGVYI